jgi:exo-beta-1,3-glucanase (GH17 family)
VWQTGILGETEDEAAKVVKRLRERGVTVFLSVTYGQTWKASNDVFLGAQRSWGRETRQTLIEKPAPSDVL